MTDAEDRFRIGKLKGFREFLPAEMRARRKVVRSVRSVADRFGFREIGTPSLEPMDLFVLKSGEELVEQTYSFEDKAGRHVTLIPEETPTRARMVLEHKELSKPIKWFSVSKFWRYENTQKGRLREFFQFNFDIFGEGSVEADAEILACAAAFLEELGIQDHADIRVNDRRILEKLLAAYGIEEKDVVLKVIDDKEKGTREQFREQLQEKGLSEAKARTIDEVTELRGPFNDVLPQLDTLVPDDDESRVAMERLERLGSLLESYGVAEACILDLSIIRGLAYYTGMVFEIFDSEGDLRAISGGGRYDDLIEEMGGRSVPAVGFGPGDATLELLMKRAGVWPEERIVTDVYVLTVSDSVKEDALDIARQLRQEDLSVETDLAGRSFGDQMKYANTINTESLIIVGERDLANDEVTVKDMASGDEEQVAVDSVVDHFSDR